MQPETPVSSFGSEKQHAPAANRLEHMPMLPAPELQPSEGLERGAERSEQAAEAKAAASDAATTLTPVPVVVPDLSVAGSAVTGTISISAPATASDDDVIEKEWVDHAKKIIEATKNDPHAREEEVSRLQKDYLKKRYGKEVGLPPKEAW